MQRLALSLNISAEMAIIHLFLFLRREGGAQKREREISEGTLSPPLVSAALQNSASM